MAVEVWSKLKPKNNANFKIADPSDVEPTLDGSNSLQDDIEALSRLISSGGSSKIYVGPDEPEDKEALWFDTDDTSSDAALGSVYAGENLVEQTYAEAIQNIKEKVDAVSYALNSEIEPGGFQIRTYTGSYIDNKDSSTSNPALDSEFYPENPDPEDDIFVPISGSNETTIYENDKYIGVSNVNTVRVKRGTKYNLPTLKDGELAFCKDTGELFIGNVNSSGYSVTKIGSSGAGGGGGSTGGNLTGEYLDLQSPNGVAYRAKVTDSGMLTILPKSLYELKAIDPEDTASLGTDYVGLVINHMYGGGAVLDPANPKKGYVSHSFVELYNGSITGKDLTLEGLSVQYKGPTGGWQSLALHGVIPFRHSFLIRGLQHFEMGPDTFTRLEIDKYDMQWNIAFSDKGFSIYLGAGTTPLIVENPYNIDGRGTKQEGYIDLVGVGGVNPQDGVSAYVERYWNFMNNQTSALRIDHFDRINTDLEPFSSRNTVQALDWSNTNVELFKPRYLAYGPWDSQESKIKLNPNAPMMINICYSYDGETGRCFNWQTPQTDQGNLYYRKLGETKWTIKESTKYHNKQHDGMFTTHKVLIKDLELNTTYEYKCGYEGHYSDVYMFKTTDFDFSANPRENSKNDIEILWTSDQQGWTEYDYTMWKEAFKTIKEREKWDFMINTGDISENGSRPFEWRYWYSMTPETTEYCHQIANGNNDLGGPKVDDSTPITYVMYNEKQHPRVHGCYTYNVGDIHFVVISSNHKDITAYDYYKSQGIAKPSKDDFYNDQFEWLREDLDDPETKKKRWCIFMTHASPISCTRMLPQQPMLSFIQEYHPHFVFCGHNHTYSRSLPLDNVPLPTITKGEFINANTGADSSIPPEITDPRSYYTHWDSGTVYVMCQSTGCKLVGKYGQVRNAWWYDWHGQHPYAPTYIKVNVTRDKVSFRSYKVNEIVPTENDLQLFYTTPPIPVGPARYKGNPIYGGTNPDPTPVNVECIDYADDEYNASDDQALVRLKDVGARSSYSWRPWGKDLTNGIDS